MSSVSCQNSAAMVWDAAKIEALWVLGLHGDCQSSKACYGSETEQLTAKL
jgi:hypothetical protein